MGDVRERRVLEGEKAAFAALSVGSSDELGAMLDKSPQRQLGFKGYLGLDVQQV
jgi:hypothetical protein